tara:strand:+ start:11654 stop:12832 length:1179 start_codon:yes stop_codon:yes gene_type:complete
MKSISIATFSKLSKEDTIFLKERKELHKINKHYDNDSDYDNVENNEYDNISDDDDGNKTIKTKKQLSNEDDVYKDIDERLIFDPFNQNNKEINPEYLQNILSKYGVPGKIHNINLYKRAFVHKSYIKRPHLMNEENNITIVEQPDNCLSLKTKSNERLEFLGDGVLECITKYYLYRRFPKANEGFMTEKKIALVKNEHIGRLAYDMGINHYYIMSKNAEEKKTRTNLKKLGCLFEAFIGALFLDFNKVDINDEDGWFKNGFVTGPGFQVAQIFVENVFEKHVNWSKIIQDDDNYKNILQVKIQKEFKTTPTYLIIEDDDDGYRMGVYLALNMKVQNILPENATCIDGKLNFNKIHNIMEDKESLLLFISDAKHKIKKKAEQQACKEAIERFD